MIQYDRLQGQILEINSKKTLFESYINCRQVNNLEGAQQ